MMKKGSEGLRNLPRSASYKARILMQVQLYTAASVLSDKNILFLKTVNREGKLTCGPQGIQVM